MANPDGYRKSMRVMEMASRWNKPIITFIDTAGAYPGVGAEERGQAEAIASSIYLMFSLGVPIVSIVIGEGGSGGALGIGVGNKILMLENANYAVISPEGCASILWRDDPKGPALAADALKLISYDLLELKVIDEIIEEPFGGAHRDWKQTFINTGKTLDKHLKELMDLSGETLKQKRYEKFRNMGVFEEKT
jgi:acetyl-CoA carboxylase carboxyl transferase subunit alpha